MSGWSCAEVHHMYGSTFKHNKILIGHLACIPLHYDFHRGKYGIHTIGSKAWVEAHDRQAVFFEKEVYEFQKEFDLQLPDQEVWTIMDYGR